MNPPWIRHWFPPVFPHRFSTEIRFRCRCSGRAFDNAPDNNGGACGEHTLWSDHFFFFFIILFFDHLCRERLRVFRIRFPVEYAQRVTRRVSCIVTFIIEKIPIAFTAYDGRSCESIVFGFFSVVNSPESTD